ncbi:protein FAM228B isoform X2 [Rhineura floridana]|uniref:protein FAM228B isoform X2 n=1 Tax=Rhineura floridana TaxID=261503 RepID=UPI002AC83A29|nr:protein FAM228B isoform X2 [Rhineura floridana]
MEAAGGNLGTIQRGLFTSTPREGHPPPAELPKRTDSSTSFSSESSGEDWLIKVCCPGARHRYCRHVPAQKRISSQPQKTGFPHCLDKEDEFVESTEQMPITSYQGYPRVPRQESSDLQWLIRLRCPRAQMEQMMADPKQSLPAVSTSLSRSPSKTCRSIPSGGTKASESWLTQKHFSIAQAIFNESQDVVGTTQALLERENNFVREVDRYLKHSDFLALRRREMLYKKWFESVSSPLLQKIQDKVDNQSSEEIEKRKRKELSLYLNYCNKKGSTFLESYSHSSYDPFFLKSSTNTWKASVPPLYDPLLKEIQGRYLEAGIIQQCDTGKIYSSKEMNGLHKVELPLLPLSRQLMNPVEWLKIPAGYMESEIRQNSRRKMSTTRNVSSMDFKSWGDPSWLLLNKRRPSARKPDFTCMPSLLTNQMLTGSSVWKSAIKSAS